MVYKRRRSYRAARPSKRRRTARVVRRTRRRQYRRMYGRVSSFRANSRSYGIGDNKVIRCRWVGTENISVLASQIVPYTGTPVLINSAYDPWSGITGTHNLSAAGFALYATMYSRYIVVGAKLVCTFHPMGVINSLDEVMAVGLLKNGSTSSITSTYGDWSKLVTDPDCNSKTIVPSTKNTAAVTVVMTYSPRKEFGIKDPKDAAINSYGPGAAVNGNPTQAIYVHPWIHSKVGNIQANQTWSVDYKLYQKVLFTNRNNLGSISNPYQIDES